MLDWAAFNSWVKYYRTHGLKRWTLLFIIFVSSTFESIQRFSFSIVFNRKNKNRLSLDLLSRRWPIDGRVVEIQLLFNWVRSWFVTHSHEKPLATSMLLTTTEKKEYRVCRHSALITISFIHQKIRMFRPFDTSFRFNEWNL